MSVISEPLSDLKIWRMSNTRNNETDSQIVYAFLLSKKD